MLYQADFFTPIPGTRELICTLCPEGECRIAEGGFCKCAVRQNRNGKLYLINYGQIAKLKAHTEINRGQLIKVLNIGFIGGNITWTFDRNWEISNFATRSREDFGREQTSLLVENIGFRFSPEQLYKYARDQKFDEIRFQFTEPMAQIEYISELHKLTKNNIHLSLVTNLYLSEEVIPLIADIFSRTIINLYSMDPHFYLKHAKANIHTVLRNVESLEKTRPIHGIHTVIVPGENSSEAQLLQIINFIKSLRSEILWALSPFYPDNRVLDREAATPEVVENAIGLAHAHGLLNCVPTQSELIKVGQNAIL